MTARQIAARIVKIPAPAAAIRTFVIASCPIRWSVPILPFHHAAAEAMENISQIIVNALRADFQRGLLSLASESVRVDSVLASAPASEAIPCDIEAIASGAKSLPQCLQTIAASCISSAQYGHVFIAVISLRLPVFEAN